MREQKGLSLTNRNQRQVTHTRRPAGHVIESDDREQQDDTGYDEPWPTKLPNSSRRYDVNCTQGNSRLEFHPKQVQRIPPRRSAQPAAQETEDIPAIRTRQRPRMHWLWYAGIGAIVALILWVGAAWLSNKWTDTQNDWTYTQVFRTFSVDKVVGHNGDSDTHPSHFIVQNDKRRIIIIELPADSAAKAIIYSGPILIGDGQDRTPITISFQVNVQTRRLDMVLHVQDLNYVFANNGTKFVEPSGQ